LARKSAPSPLFLDNAQVLNPFQAKLPKDSVNHRVVARSDGYIDGEQEVVFDGTEVVIKLERTSWPRTKVGSSPSASTNGRSSDARSSRRTCSARWRSGHAGQAKPVWANELFLDFGSWYALVEEVSRVPNTPWDEQTAPETFNPVGGAENDTDRQLQIGFVVLWSADEPDCMGAWLPITNDDGREPRVLGRGPARADDRYPRLSPLRQRPEQNELLAPLRSQGLSRAQLLIRPLGSQLLEITNLGQRRLLVNGTAGDKHTTRPDDVVEIGSRLALLCTMRPRSLGGSMARPGHHFGQADEWGFVGESPAAWQLRWDIAFAAQRAGHVLILGPTGTGKELAARGIHAFSGRVGALVSRNAATIPESLVDAELFGNPKGYPNPGVPEREGLIGAAHRGSLFLDEFADLPSGAQAHVLRVLDSGEYQRLGETQQRRSEFRLIAATNHPETSLRADLFARFDFCLRMPDLAARREDIPLLMRHLFMLVTRDEPELRERYSLPNGLPRTGPGFIRRLVRQPLGANVRELRQILWRSLGEGSNSSLEWPLPQSESEEPPHAAVQRALDANNGSLEKTWRALGLSNRYELRRLIAKHGLVVTRRGGDT
jgi:transcriptional regulator with AAA-type ATPase domain